ncbi:MAG: aminopeptidase P family protein [Clostridiales bacterium]|nr:aminopeptidase P family protein [Clostridiales bacterium]
MQQRLERLRAALSPMDALLIASPSSRFYLSGFKGTAGTLFITRDEAIYIADGRYIEAVSQQVRHMTVQLGGLPQTGKLAELCAQHGVRRLGFEDREVTVATYHQYQQALPGVELLPVDDLIVRMRMYKDAREIALIQQAQDISDRAFLEVLDFVRAGRSERDCAKVLEEALFRHGAEALSFPTISVGGARSSLPHGRPSDYVLRDGDFLTMDFGAVYGGYVSDMTRTFAIGRISDEMAHVYETVLRAQEAAIAAAKPGALCSDIDRVARDVITEAGYGEYFSHSLGHSIGIDVHEEPRFSPTCQEVLQPGVCITVEPGIYLPGRFGVRIEDDILITQDGCRNFTAGPKALCALRR